MYKVIKIILTYDRSFHRALLGHLTHEIQVYTISTCEIVFD